MANSFITDAYGRSNDERKELAAQLKLINEDARDNWYEPQWKREMAQQMTETIFEGFEHENLLSLMAETENAPFDGRVFVKEVRGLRAFWIARGGDIEESTINAEIMELPRDTIAFSVSEFEDKIRTNFAETQATLIDLGVERMVAEVNRTVLSLFQAAIPLGHASYVGSTGLTLVELNTAIREVRDESKSQEIAIVGRAAMIESVYDLILGTDLNGGAFLPETNEELVRRGVMGTYRGARLISLKNFKDDQDISFFPNNELYVLGRDASKFAFWGGLMAKEYETPDNWYWHYLARRDFGGIVHRPERARRIVDSSI